MNINEPINELPINELISRMNENVLSVDYDFWDSYQANTSNAGCAVKFSHEQITMLHTKSQDQQSGLTITKLEQHT